MNKNCVLCPNINTTSLVKTFLKRHVSDEVSPNKRCNGFGFLFRFLRQRVFSKRNNINLEKKQKKCKNAARILAWALLKYFKMINGRETVQSWAQTSINSQKLHFSTVFIVLSTFVFIKANINKYSPYNFREMTK